MNKLFDQFLPPEEDVSWDNNVDDLDSFDEINSEGVSHDYDDDRETEVFDTSSSISEYEPDSTTHLPKEIKLPQDKTDSHSFVKKNTGYEFVCSNSQVANLCHDLKEILRVTEFFIIYVKCGCYNSGSGAQVLVVIDFKLHWF